MGPAASRSRVQVLRCSAGCVDRLDGNDSALFQESRAVAVKVERSGGWSKACC